MAERTPLFRAPASALASTEPIRGDGVEVREVQGVADAGARYTVLRFAGERSADLINTGCSLDLRATAFAPGTRTGSRFEQVPVIIHRTAVDGFDVWVERPLARHLWQWLHRAAADLERAATDL